MKKIIVFLLIPLAFISAKPKKNLKKITEAKNKIEEIKIIEPKEISIIKNSYPDLNIQSEFVQEKNDWILSFKNNEKNFSFWWKNGSILPEDELINQENYWTILYSYPAELRDPASMTDEEKAKLKEFSSRQNRRNGKGTPMFFFDAVYDSFTRLQLESHLVRTKFLGCPTTIHKRILDPLKKIEEKIYKLAEEDDEIKNFIEKIKSCDAYHWRLIDGTNRKSFHSLGIAIDILPKRITGEIFWSWARDKNPEGWMLTPLKKRWLPPKKVVQIFEEEGFVWGGKWAIWDNMHFEYHPELIEFNKITKENL